MIPLLTFVYAAIAAVFGLGSVCLLVLAARELWSSVAPAEGVTLAERAAAAIESIGLVTVALMSLEMAADGSGGRSGAAGTCQRADAR